MSLLRTLRKLVVGETWTLPLGLALVLVAALVVRAAAPDLFESAGGFVLLAGVLLVSVVSVSVSAGRVR